MNCDNVYRIIICSILIIGISSCKSESNESNHVKTSEDDLITFLNTYHDAMNQYGLKTEFEFIDSTSHFFWIPPGYASALSFDSVKKVLIQTDETIRSIRLKWKNLKIESQESNWANFHGVVEGQIVDTSGLIIIINQIESGVLIKRKDGWKILSGQTTALDIGSDFDPKSIDQVDMPTVIILPVGDYYLISRDKTIQKAADKNQIADKLKRMMQSESSKKIKIMVSHQAVYNRVHFLLSLFSENSWIPVMSMIDLENP